MLVPLKEYKVAYWKGGDILNSEMFDTVSEARRFISGLPQEDIYTLMQSKDVGNGSYSWVVLQDGVGRLIPALSWVYRNRKPVGYGLGFYVLYKVLK